MANFELIGYVKGHMNVGTRTRLTVGEYVQGKRDESGAVKDEKMDLWYIFFPQSSRKHLMRFKPNDLVIIKGTIHLTGNAEYPHAINGEGIKHFYTRNLFSEIKREQVESDERPDLQDYMNQDF